MVPIEDLEGTTILRTDPWPRLLYATPSEACYECQEDGTRLFLHPKQSRASLVSVSWKVHNVGQTVRELQKKGVVVFDKEDSAPDLSHAVNLRSVEAVFFEDPEGNLLCVAEMEV